MDRTKIVPNHVEGEYDIRWSFLMRVAVWFMGIIATVAAAALIAMAALGFTTVQKLNIIDERQQTVITNQKEMKGDIKSINDKIAAEDYVSHEEFAQWINSSERAKAINSIVEGKPYREMEK